MFLTVYIIALTKRIFSFSNLVSHIEILKDLVKHDFENADEQVQKILLIAYNQIYQMATLVTTVGYGDGISTPNLPEFPLDYDNQLVFMMFGVFIFRFNQAALTQQINCMLNNEYSLQKYQQDLKEDIEQYF